MVLLNGVSNLTVPKPMDTVTGIFSKLREKKDSAGFCVGKKKKVL